MHSDRAVESITLSPRSIASRWVSSGMNLASGLVAGSESKTPSTPFLAIRMASVPYSRSPINASPDSFRRMRWNFVSFISGVFADLEIREARHPHILAGLGGELGPQLLDRLALVLVRVDVRLAEQRYLGLPLGQL